MITPDGCTMMNRAVENMELLTIRGYNGDLMERYASGPEVFLLQRTQSTARIVRKNR